MFKKPVVQLSVTQQSNKIKNKDGIAHVQNMKKIKTIYEKENHFQRLEETES